MRSVSPDDLRQACSHIYTYVRRTPLVRSSTLSAQSGGDVYLKLENLQETGSFKVRGAANRLLQMTLEERARGVIAFSTGNHGRALAWVGRQLGVRVVICMPPTVLAHKVAAIRALGAEVRVVGKDQDSVEAEAVAMAAREGLCWVSPFDDPWIIAGQGTIGLEILDDLPTVEVVMAALSGGGLLGGLALGVKSKRQAAQVVGVTMARGAAMVTSLAAGKPVAVTEEPTLADSLVGGIGLHNQYTFDLVRRIVDATVLVSETEIARAMRYALQTEKMVVEGGGAVGLAALLAGKIDVAGKQTVCVISGGNVDEKRLAQLLTEKEVGEKV
jgi:threonine dehydratase